MPCRGCGKNSGRAVGEIGEALPVAEEASRFQGSAPIGGHDSDRKSVGTTVGNRRPLRKRYKGCNGRATARVAPTEGLQEAWEKNPPVTASPCQPPLGKGAEGAGVRIATGALRPRNDMVFARGAAQKRRADRGVRPYGSVTGGAMGGRPQGSPLRRVTRGCGTAGRCRRSPLRDHFGFIYIGKFIFPGQKRNIYEYII